ncbi:hypothetical protein P378_00470 [Desulforamulus profundi]|uniref:DUF1444 family protein n=4 Tax=Desulforamulus profundi TaxID=1383067 RepID=A0A2C6MJZ1_9FIRM|nr:hypothetical protein P378_00470 [Desulforamulus profundi]
MMDRQTFRKTVSEYILDAVPKSLIYNLDYFAIRMKKGEYWIDLSLENFYRGYCRQRAPVRPRYIAKVLAPFIKDLRRERGISHLDVKENLHRLYPLLVGPQDAKGIVTDPLIGELSMAYVLDEGMRIFFLDQQTVKQLGFSMEKIYRIALRNFFRDLVKPLQVFDESRKIYGFNYGDTYDSSRLLALLLTPAKQGLSPKQRVLTMVPNRDVVMLFSPADQAVLRQAFMIGHSSFINNPYPISGSVYELHNGIIKEYQGLINHN